MFKKKTQNKQIPKSEKEITQLKRKLRSQTDCLLDGRCGAQFPRQWPGTPGSLSGGGSCPVPYAAHRPSLSSLQQDRVTARFFIQANEGHGLAPSLVRHNPVRRETAAKFSWWW